MNRIDRLFTILLLLQTQKRLRAQDLGHRFSISKRTVYRDIAALTEMGVPIVSLPGEGYELMPGYYLPPIVFTPKEASALFLSVHMLLRQAEGAMIQDAQEALAKITAVMPKPSLQQAEQLSQIIEFIQPQDGRFNLDDPSLYLLLNAILNHNVVHMSYHSYSQNETTERQVEPLQLFYNNGIWYFNGYCRLRQANREFRLDRIDTLRRLEETFEERPSSQPSTNTILVKILFTHEIVRWVRERQHYAYQTEETNGQGIIMSYLINNPNEIIHWLRSWGADAQILEPPALRQQLQQEAKKLSEMLT